MSENNQPDKTSMEDAIRALCSIDGFLKKRVQELDDEFFVQDLIEAEGFIQYWSPNPIILQQKDRKYIQLSLFKTRRGCAKNALRTLEKLHLWKDPISSVQDYRRQQELKAVMSNLVSLEDASDEDLETHLHRINVAVAWYDILTHLPCQIYNKFHNDWRINHLDVRVITRLECHNIKGNHLIYLYDQKDRRIDKLVNNIGWLRSFTRSMPLEEAERIGVQYYGEYNTLQLDAYGRIKSTVKTYEDNGRKYVESIKETFQRDPRRAVARVGKSYEIIEYHKEFQTNDTF